LPESGLVVGALLFPLFFDGICGSVTLVGLTFRAGDESNGWAKNECEARIAQCAASNKG
jgi:hypothetical protein